MKPYRNPFLFPLYAGIFFALVLGIVVGILVAKNTASVITPYSPPGGVVNMQPLDMNKRDDFFGGAIIVPPGYFVTNDSMLVSYASQGGMAPPRVILMKGYQVLGEEAYYDAVTKNPSHECIAMWTTGGVGSIDAWESDILQFMGKRIEKTDISVGKRNAQVYTLEKKEGNIYEAMLQVSEKNGGTTYYFNTCNTKNKQDFTHVISSLKLRADLLLQ